MPPQPPFRRFLFAFALIALVGAGVVWWMNPKPSPSPRVQTVPSVTHVGPDERLDVTHDATLVFQKALWRRPTPDDVILRAERREIADAAHDNVKNWQWFLAVQPGNDLRSWLDTNPFSLNSVPTRAAQAGAIPLPEWFPHDLNGFVMQQNAEGRLVFWYSAAQNLLYATDSGFGFSDVQRSL